jgi:hypothetical protein
LKSKYIIIELAGVEVPLVFSEFLTHEEAAGRHKVQSAGFCELDAAGKWVTSGQSVSLRLVARPQDDEILNTHLDVAVSSRQPTRPAGKRRIPAPEYSGR